MSQKVCKWCGREFDGRNAEGVGGWATCSERCKHKLKRSVQDGDTKAAKHPLVQLIRFVVVVGAILLSIGALVNLFKAIQPTSVTSTTSETTQALEPVPYPSSLDIVTDSGSSNVSNDSDQSTEEATIASEPGDTTVYRTEEEQADFVRDAADADTTAVR